VHLQYLRPNLSSMMNTSAFAASYLSTPLASTSSRAPPICTASSSPSFEPSRITRRAALATLTFSEVSNDKYGYTFSAPTAGWTRTDTTLNGELNSKMNAYVCEYTITPGADKEKRHLLTVFSLQPGRFIITLTAQTKEDDWEKNSALFRRVADSYRIKIMDD